MSKRVGSASVDAHLAQVEKTLGRKVEARQAPPLPTRLSHVWEMFLSLHDGRTYGINDPNPLSYLDIDAWRRLHKRRLSSWHIDLVKDLDMAFLKAMGEDSKNG